MEQNENLIPEEKEEREHYVPRPKWQIVLAWIALAIFVIGVILYYFHIMYKF